MLSELTITPNQHHFGGLYMPSFGSTATDKAVKNRLLKMARSCARFPLIVRRRRLGVQNVIDLTKLFPPTNTRCIQCEKFLLVAKMCRLCGQGVCQSCSAKHYRETQDRRTLRSHVHHIRVCDICMDRVDLANYSFVTHTSLAAPRIERDPRDAKRASTVLRTLLQEAYESAASPERKASVLSVIRCVADQEARASSNANGSPIATVRSPPPMTLASPAPTTPPTTSTSTPTPTTSTPSTTTTSASSPGVVLTLGLDHQDIVNALEFVNVETVNHLDAEVAHVDGRGYVIDPRHPDKHITHPMPVNESQRLQAIANERLREMGNVHELNIVCDLAARELDCFATMITVIDEDVQLILGANREDLRAVQFPRADTFCSHIIMDNKPLIIPHPEADIRFHQCGPVQHFGARYYCGFPLLARDGTVLGSLCCVDTKTHRLTASQYTALQKLAQTAAKIVRRVTTQLEEQQLAEELRNQACCSRCKSRTSSMASAPAIAS